MGKRDKKNSEYVQAYVPDTMELAALVQLAKGRNRSMAEFARSCKVKGPSTFSRIVNRLIDKPLSDELIYAIADNAADKQTVTLDALMRANGKLPKDEMINGKVPTQDNYRKKYESHNEIIKLAREIVLRDLYEKEQAVMVYPDLLKSGKMPKSRYALLRLTDFAIHVQGNDPLYWNFIVDFSDLSGTSVKADNTGMLKESMHRYSSLFLCDAWEPDNMRDFKNTIVFIEERAFRTFYEMLSDVKLNTWMSVMLLDTENKLIKEEIELKRKKRT